MSVVLVVEDNTDLAQNIAELLEDAGAEVEISASADQALAFARRRVFDLALVDLLLSGTVNGVQLLPQLRELSPHGEIILITGYASLDTAIEAVKQGVYAYVQKPFAAGDLLALGERALAQVRLRRQREALAQELRRSEVLYRGVVDTVDSLIFGLDDEDRVRFLNRCAVETLGLGDDDLRGQLFTELAIPEDRDRLQRSIDSARAGVARERPARLAAAGRDPSVVRFSFAALPATGGIEGMLLAVGRDDTRRLELERRTAQSEAMAAMGALTAGLAHEVRNPLNAAKLQLELLARTASKVGDPALTQRLEDRVGIVKLEIARLSNMLDEFLALARPTQIEARPFDLQALVHEVVRLEGPLAQDAQVQLGYKSCPGGGLVSGERSKVKQVLVNLIGNAVEAMQKVGGGRVEVSCRLVGDGAIAVLVSDTGPGVPEHVADQVFEPFFTTKEAGTGLGLTIVKRLIELHGGEVELRGREDGQGTVARFTLPLAGKVSQTSGDPQ